ncbi:MAG: hypothetical protein LBP59_10675 [Planctomycetaceae bacterium]|jgi:hypothetical protein|nr:hypothetical protein [Planctomycetaceae bacterium]
MLQIRQSVFETNSSAIHAFWVKTQDKIAPFAEEQVMTAHFSSLGWEYEPYKSGEFLNVIWTWLISAGLFDNMSLFKRITEILKQYNIRVNWTLDILTEEEVRDINSIKDFMFADYMKDLVEQPELLISLILSDSSNVIHADEGDIFEFQKRLASSHTMLGVYTS